VKVRNFDWQTVELRSTESLNINGGSYLSLMSAMLEILGLSDWYKTQVGLTVPNSLKMSLRKLPGSLQGPD